MILMCIKIRLKYGKRTHQLNNSNQSNFTHSVKWIQTEPIIQKNPFIHVYSLLSFYLFCSWFLLTELFIAPWNGIGTVHVKIVKFIFMYTQMCLIKLYEVCDFFHFGFFSFKHEFHIPYGYTNAVTDKLI